MPKRPNPFGDCSPLQMKVHVGKKEIDMGISQDQNMKIVYAKTKQLLYDGSKRTFSSSSVMTDANDNHVLSSVSNGTSRPANGMLPEDVSIEMESDGSNPNQLHITPTGTLSSSPLPACKNVCKPGSDRVPKLSWAQMFHGSKRGPVGSSSCQFCKGQAASQDRCGFCEKSVCQGCIRQCQSCSGNFCQLCSVMNYDEVTERAFCLNCSS
ncbi:hypothetical protein CHS0354_029411 [Potamilus streckersoni]|uniref:Apoptosis regulatory protein Siva n=1 Tax=Potamilus streckersoni TaxID=2493646 RepID=A0AAE0W2G0_9BIVA|nr:hypothetical protein CHS0354_029411 [Potamilus streckersoni]